jgi:putative FmdB family regulatory protein
MPLYEYQCEACGHRFEKIRKFSDPPLDACPVCGGHVRKLLSSPAIQFKGTGWYITDYAKKSSTDSGQPGSKSTAEGRQSGDKGESESKTDKGDKPGAGSKSDSSAKSGTGDKGDTASGKTGDSGGSTTSSQAGTKPE